MAHYKRKRSRMAGEPRGSRPSTRWSNRWPRWHDILFHRRPFRRHEARLANSVLKGVLDADEALWPRYHRPHVYYS